MAAAQSRAQGGHQRHRRHSPHAFNCQNKNTLTHTHTAKNKQQNTQKQKRTSTTKYGSREAAETAEPTPKAKARELHKVGKQDLPPPHKVATQMHVTRQSGEGRGPGCQRENPLESMRRQSCYARVRSPKVVKFYMERRTGAPCGGGTEERGEEGGAATHMCA